VTGKIVLVRNGSSLESGALAHNTDISQGG
jgi:hypothetical protein